MSKSSEGEKAVKDIFFSTNKVCTDLGNIPHSELELEVEDDDDVVDLVLQEQMWEDPDVINEAEDEAKAREAEESWYAHGPDARLKRAVEVKGMRPSHFVLSAQHHQTCLLLICGLR